MANTVNIRVVEDGSKYLLAHVYLESDGVSGELSNQVLVDRKDHPPLPDGGKLMVDELWHSLSGFDVVLSYASFPDQPVWVVTQYSEHIKFDHAAGALKDAGGIDSLSQLLMSTSGFNTIGDKGSFIIRVRKG